MANQLLRTWQIFELADVTKHLIMMGDIAGDCANCREIGIDLRRTAECPQCHTVFKYAASRRAANHPGERFQVARRIQEIRPNLIIIDYEDYQKITSSQKARDFFKS